MNRPRLNSTEYESNVRFLFSQKNNQVPLPFSSFGSSCHSNVILEIFYILEKIFSQLLFLFKIHLFLRNHYAYTNNNVANSK